MEVSSQDPAVMAMDLSKSFSSLSRAHPEAVDLAKKPEWYHRRPPSCIADSAPPFRSRASSSYGLLSAQPGGAVHCRDMDQGPEDLRSYMNSALAPRLDLYHDAEHSDLWHPNFYGTNQSGFTAPESTGGEDSDSGSDVIFLVSSPKAPLLCGSFLQDGVRHMVEPLSPAASSLDGGRGCFLLPQHTSSPSADTSYSEDSSDSSVDISVRHARPMVLLSDFRTAYATRAESADASSDDSDVIEVSVTNGDGKIRRCEEAPSEGATSPQEEVQRRPRTRKPVSRSPQTCGAVLRRGLQRRVKNVAVGIYNEGWDSDKLMEYALRLSTSEDSEPPEPPPRPASDKSHRDVRTGAKTPPRKPQPPGKASRSKNRKKKAPLAQRNLSEKNQRRLIPTAPPQQNHEVCRTKPPTRRKRKRRPLSGPPTPFPLREPEIQLKYANPKADRKHRRSSFCPFVHMERRLCRVVNYEEEEAARSSGGAPASSSLSGFLPSSSCFQLGRHGSASAFQAAPLCCLCGQSANATNLGDLHGPYRPAGSARDCEVHGGPHGAATEGPRPPADLAQHLDECWIHEDCGIWSTGVFLVRGKLYGLEEAARLARETVCSACQKPGAVMGCFLKGCSRSYHYPCALQSGCFLNEENFSMRCPGHKNKTLTAANRKRRR